MAEAGNLNELYRLKIYGTYIATPEDCIAKGHLDVTSPDINTFIHDPLSTSAKYPYS